METASGGTTISEEMAEEAESHDLLTLGIEEEYILVDAVESRGVEVVEQVVDLIPDEIRGSVQHEYLRSQIEVASPPQLELSGLHEAMRKLRKEVADRESWFAVEIPKPRATGTSVWAAARATTSAKRSDSATRSPVVPTTETV